jgi:uncharacterized protein YodC (DUF2158 family)
MDSIGLVYVLIGCTVGALVSIPLVRILRASLHSHLKRRSSARAAAALSRPARVVLREGKPVTTGYIQNGDTVRLKPDGPLMTVVSVSDWWVTGEWVDNKGRLRRRRL